MESAMLNCLINTGVKHDTVKLLEEEVGTQKSTSTVKTSTTVLLLNPEPRGSSNFYFLKSATYYCQTELAVK